MNFRDLFSKLDELTAAPVQQDPKQAQTTQQPKAAPAAPAAPAIPGQQPELGAKPQLTPQQLQAMQFPNQKPAPAPATVTDPKADIAAMTQALQAVAQQNKPPVIQPTTSASVQQQQQVAQQPKQIATPKPGEPMEEDQVNEATREEKIQKWKDWYAKNPDKADQVPAAIRDQVTQKADVKTDAAPAAPAGEKKTDAEAQAKKTQELGAKFVQEKDPAKKEQLRKEYEAEAGKLKQMQGEKTPPQAGKEKKQWAPGTLGQGTGMSGKPDVGVAALQKKLADAGYDLGKEGVDGRYGPKTSAAVRKFQADWNEKNPTDKIAVDGTAGKQTLPKIMNLEKPATSTPPASDSTPPTQGFNKGEGEVSSPNPALAGDEQSGTRWVAPDARSTAPDTELDKLPAGKRDALDTTYSPNADNTDVIPTVDKSTYSKNAWIEKHDKRSGWEKTMPNWLGGKDLNIPDQPNYKTTPGEQPYRNPAAKPTTTGPDYSKMTPDQRASEISSLQAQGKDVPDSLRNPQTAPVKEDAVIAEMNSQIDALANDLINEDATTMGSKWATKSAKLAPWVGNVAKGANVAISAKDIADYAKKGDKIGAGIASAALAADAAGTVFPPASWASFALDMANAGRDVYLKQTGQEYPDPDQKALAKEDNTDLDKIKHLTQYKAGSK